MLEEADGTTRIEQRQFGAFKRDRRALADWPASLRPDEVVMESTGIYWKSPYAALEAVGIRGQVVNARHVKNRSGWTQTCHRRLGAQNLRTFFFMVKRREHYRDSGTDYEALSVQRNAPRCIKALTRLGFIPAAD